MWHFRETTCNRERDMNEDDPKPDAYIPLCHVCGKPMRLIGLRAKAAKLGLRLPNDELDTGEFVTEITIIYPNGTPASA
jgi:hypothetical protein